MVEGRVDLDHVPATQFVLEGVASAASSGQTGGEHHGVIGQGRGRDPMQGVGFAQGGQHDRSGDPGVGGHRQREA